MIIVAESYPFNLKLSQIYLDSNLFRFIPVWPGYVKSYFAHFVLGQNMQYLFE